jgi:hypothetical protein
MRPSPSVGGVVKGRLGAAGHVPAVKAERPLSVQSGDVEVTRGKGRDAPIPDLPAGRRWNIKFEEMGSVDYTVDLHRMTAPNVSIPS